MSDIVLLTGGTGGIGRAIAARLVESGYAVVAGDLEVRDRAAQSGDGPLAAGTIVERHLDVRSSESINALVAQTVSLGRLRGVVNCAGIVRDTPAATMDDSQIDALWAVNVAGTARVCRAAAPHLESGSAIVNIGSIAGSVGRFPRLSIYSATKVGLEGLTRVLACELAPRGVRVNLVAPGFIRVGMSKDWRDISGGEEALATHVPLGRLGEASEIAEVVEFLLSPRASYITGAAIFVDGGTHAW